MAGKLKVVPLGGLGEIGMNCLALERDDDIIVIDCGVMFPGEEVGVDVIHPDLSFLKENASKIRGVFLTHGHEDHIGAIPYLLRNIEVPIFSPAYAARLVAERLKQNPTVQEADIRRTSPGERIEAGAFTVSPLRVTHSIADSTALVIETPEHVIVHSGDYRLDDNPIDGQKTELERLGRLGARGVDLLLSDSTNIERPGTFGSEQSVADTIESLAREARGAVFVALFSSNTPRLQLIMRVAQNLGRKVALAGRSVLTHVRVANELGYLEFPSNLLVGMDQVATCKPDELLYIMTGTQGEPRSALGRLASGRLRGVNLGEGDLVVISGRFIPGNDIEIYRMVSSLTRRGARVVHSRAVPGVHCSGHGHREEQRRLMETVNPRAFVPVHGAFHHLAQHAELAREIGVADIRIVENGEPIELDDQGRLNPVEPVRVGRVHVDGTMGVSELVLRDRRSLRSGVALAILAMDLDRGELVVPPQIVARGVGDERNFPSIWARASDAVREAFELTGQKVRRDPTAIRDVAARALKKFLSRDIDRHPTTLAVVIEIRNDANGAEIVEPEELHDAVRGPSGNE